MIWVKAFFSMCLARLSQAVDFRIQRVYEEICTRLSVCFTVCRICISNGCLSYICQLIVDESVLAFRRAKNETPETTVRNTVCFLIYMILCYIYLSLVNHIISYLKIYFKTERRLNLTLGSSYLQSFRSSLQFHPLWVTQQVI